jgi:hypothetical protein
MSGVEAEGNRESKLRAIMSGVEAEGNRESKPRAIMSGVEAEGDHVQVGSCVGAAVSLRADGVPVSHVLLAARAVQTVSCRVAVNSPKFDVTRVGARVTRSAAVCVIEVRGMVGEGSSWRVEASVLPSVTRSLRR